MLILTIRSNFNSVTTTKTIRNQYLLRKWYHAIQLPHSEHTNSIGNRINLPTIFDNFSSKLTNQLKIHDSNLKWRPFLSSANGIGNRFFARLSSPKTDPIQRDNSSITAAESQWTPEDTYDLNESIIKLLTLNPENYPKPCDPLTFCFWDHGLFRRFEKMSTKMATESIDNLNLNSLKFTVCSYNVLCQRALGYYLEKLYSHCPFEHLTWQRRWELLAVELQMLDSDIFCLQEVQADHYEQHFMPLLSKLGYDGVFKKKLKKKNDGCATFWRRDKFRQKIIYPIDYSFPSPHDYSDSVALVTVLEPIPNSINSSIDKSLIVANTHLIHAPACGATKLLQTATLLAHLQKITQSHGTSNSPAPLILCGDLNSTPYSPLYSLLTDGELTYEGLNGWSISGQHQHSYQSGNRRINVIGDATLGPSLLPEGTKFTESCKLIDPDLESEQISQSQSGRLSHDLNLRSVYDHVTKNGEREVTTFLRDQPIAVDYIFYSVDDKEIKKDSNDSKLPWTTTRVKENDLKCLERYRLPGPSHLNRMIGYLPNQYCASDHLPLMAKFSLTC